MPKKVSTKIQEFRGRRTKWINVSDASLKTLRELSSRFPLHEHDLRELLPPLQNTKCIVRQKYVFLVLIIPVRNERSRDIREVELDILISGDTLVTVNHANRLIEMVSIIDEMGNAAAREKFLAESPSNALLSILEKIYRSIFPTLLELSRDIRDVEKRIFEHYGDEKIIRDVLMLKNNNTRVRKALKTHRYSLTQLKSAVAEFSPVNAMNFTQVIDQTVDIWNSLEADRETIDTLHDTIGTLVSNRINKIMKTLTIFTSILLPLSFFAGIAIIEAPPIVEFIHRPFSIFIILSIMAATTLSMLAFFKAKRWI